MLFDEAFWRRLINFDVLIEEGMIKEDDMKLLAFAETAEEAWSALVERGLRDHGPPQPRR